MPFLVVVAVLGLLIGILSGLLGIGGGMFMIPLFRLGFSMSAFQATATSLFAVVPTSLAGLASHIHARTCIPALGIVAGITGALTSPVGVLLANASPAVLVMAVASVAIAWSALTMLHKALLLPHRAADRSGDATQQGAAWQDEVKQNSVQQDVALCEPEAPSRTMLVQGACIGVFAGLLSGYIGVGGGIVMIPLFTVLLGLPMVKAAGTSMIAVCILSVPGAVQQILLGNVVLDVGIAIVTGSIPGAIVGARLVRKVPERALRIVFALLLLGLAVSLGVNEIAG